MTGHAFVCALLIVIIIILLAYFGYRIWKQSRPYPIPNCKNYGTHASLCQTGLSACSIFTKAKDRRACKGAIGACVPIAIIAKNANCKPNDASCIMSAISKSPSSLSHCVNAVTKISPSGVAQMLQKIEPKAACIPGANPQVRKSIYSIVKKVPHVINWGLRVVGSLPACEATTPAQKEGYSNGFPWAGCPKKESYGSRAGYICDTDKPCPDGEICIGTTWNPSGNKCIKQYYPQGKESYGSRNVGSTCSVDDNCLSGQFCVQGLCKPQFPRAFQYYPQGKERFVGPVGCC